jgi:hypothetical protein
MKRAKITINVQHDYLTLKLPVGNFTTSYGGAKASGQLASMPGAFKALDSYVQEHAKKRTYKEVFDTLMNPELMDTLVPGWDNPKTLNASVGDTVKFTNPIFSKKYPGNYVVKSMTPKYVNITVMEKGKPCLIGFPKHELELVKK